MSAIKEYSSFVDGFYGTPRRVYTSPKMYPFAVNGDLTSAIYTSTYRVDPAAWTPAVRGSVDPDNAGYYLIAETEPDDATSAATAVIRRTYANVPAVQTIARSLRVPKPSISGTFTSGFLAFGSIVIHQPDASQAIYDAYVKQAVTSDSGAVLASGYPSGGTYTISFAGYTTTSLSYDATAATVQTALAALTSVSNRGGISVSGTYNSTGGFALTFASYSAITCTQSWGQAPVSGTNGYYTQSFTPSANAMDIVIDYSALTTTGGAGAYGAYGNLQSSTTTRDFQINATTNYNGGSYKLTIDGHQTAAIPYSASYADVQTALNALGIGTFTVSKGVNSDTQPLNGNRIEALVTWVQVAPQSGTYTLTAFGTTTSSLAVTASAATVQSALNAIAAVSQRGGVTVTGSMSSPSGLSLAFANAAVTVNSSLSPSGASGTGVTTDSGIGRTQKITFSSGPGGARSAYCANHGFTTANDLYAGVTSGGVVTYCTIPAGTFTLPDASTVVFSSASGAVYSQAGTITEIGKLTKSGYAPGTQLARVKEITYFYLPGVTAGITTADDIPRPTFQGDDSTLLEQVLSGASSINYQVGELQNWRDSPILSLTVIQLNALDL